MESIKEWRRNFNNGNKNIYKKEKCEDCHGLSQFSADREAIQNDRNVLSDLGCVSVRGLASELEGFSISTC